MRAIQVAETGGPEVLTPVELADPEPAPGEVLVEVGAAGVNFIDTYQRSGVYRMEVPFVPGLEGTGRVTAVGSGVTRFSAGDRVAWAQTSASYAERVAVPADGAVLVPEGVSDEQAAAMPLQGMTAHYLVASTRPVGHGDTVLVHAAAGGVGLLLVQLAKARGARVLGTVSTDEKEHLARTAGADEIIRYTEADVAEEVRRLTGGAGVDVVYDGVGRDTFDASLASLRPRGMLVLFGGSSGQVPPFDLQRLNAGGSLFVTRPTLAHHIADRAELEWRARELFDLIASGRLDLRIGGRYPLQDARQAHEDLEARRTSGKLLLLPA
ncbi:quinone oxidoreductase family protein [Actinoalloteichus spitiensis]|uniref:quinone oxidoreductase family protein n=1 Tax=Actinoalloteichus spitiensis TaxID=252394 RepID=UPI000363F649|nr:quinone oxidoreductase [Actinoalloteichus spitiensis]